MENPTVVVLTDRNPNHTVFILNPEERSTAGAPILAAAPKTSPAAIRSALGRPAEAAEWQAKAADERVREPDDGAPIRRAPPWSALDEAIARVAVVVDAVLALEVLGN